MCSRIGVSAFGICADAPASAGPESASNALTRIREDFIFDFLLVQNSWRTLSMNLSVLPGLSLNIVKGDIDWAYVSGVRNCTIWRTHR